MAGESEWETGSPNMQMTLVEPVILNNADLLLLT